MMVFGSPTAASCGVSPAGLPGRPPAGCANDTTEGVRDATLRWARGRASGQGRPAHQRRGGRPGPGTAAPAGGVTPRRWPHGRSRAPSTTRRSRSPRGLAAYDTPASPSWSRRPANTATPRPPDRSAAAATICSCRAATATATSGPPAGRTSTTRSPCPPSAAHLAGTADGAPTPATPTPGTRRPGTTCPPRAMARALSCPRCAASPRRPTGRSRDAAGTDPKTPGATAAASAALGRQAAAAAPATHVINRPGLPRRPARTQPGPAAKDKPDP
jgi:hypothetical protein